MSFPEQPFGFVAGRWVRSIGDTPDDPDRAPDYVPVETGTVLFTPQVTHRVAADNTGWAGIIKERIPARLGERGQLIDAEGHDHLALAAGVYSVSYDFGSGRSWPSHYIEVKPEHTATAPLWLPPIAPPPVGPMIENRVVTIPADGADGQVLVWDGGGFSWDDPPEGPEGPEGPMGSIDGLDGVPRLTNLFHGTTRTPIDATINSQTVRTVGFTATARNGHVRPGGTVDAGATYYFTAAVKATSDEVYVGTLQGSAYHSGSGDWERLTGWFTPSVSLWFTVTDQRSSGWDQIEVRDLVLIDLTAVFGAGREPTVEYMDALLAKHGNYIGGVDQFAVGDALQALTVAGPGMGLRYDNSVGTRVFLDHPGGSTMIYGDTGWRNIDDLATIGEAVPGQPTKIRRINDQVYFTFRRDAVESASTILSLPSGWFTGQSNERLYASGAQGNAALQFRIAGVLSGLTGNVQPIATGIENATLTLNTNWATTLPWPDTLPGIPA